MQSTIAIADDHVMIRKALAAMIENFGGYRVIVQASNGQELIEMLDAQALPTLVLLDISMPVMDGMAAAKQLSLQYPQLKILALSMMDNEQSIIGMIRHGARGFILKNSEPEALKQAMYDVIHKGFHYSDLVTGKLVHLLQKGVEETGNSPLEPQLSNRELEFIKLCCTEFTYKEIADRMHVSPRTVDGYRESLFEKLGLKSRVGLALYAIRLGLFTV